MTNKAIIKGLLELHIKKTEHYVIHDKDQAEGAPSCKGCEVDREFSRLRVAYQIKELKKDRKRIRDERKRIDRSS